MRGSAGFSQHRKPGRGINAAPPYRLPEIIRRPLDAMPSSRQRGSALDQVSRDGNCQH